METPETEAGKLTEQIMAAVIKKNPTISVTDYNRVFSAVLEVLTLRFPPASGVVKFQGGGGMFICRSKS